MERPLVSLLSPKSKVLYNTPLGTGFFYGRILTSATLTFSSDGVRKKTEYLELSTSRDLPIAHIIALYLRSLDQRPSGGGRPVVAGSAEYRVY